MKGKTIKDLSKPITQSGGDELTPFEQAKRYANFLPNSEQPRWILVVLSPVKLTLIKTKTQFFLSDQIVVIFRHGLVISFSGNELIREVHYSSTNLFL